VRIVLFPILLLQAVAAFAQVTVSAEVVSEPLLNSSTPVTIAVPAVAMAKDRTGLAIAWVMQSPADGGDRIYVARIDATAHIAGAVHVIPNALPGYAVGPSLARNPSGEGFTLAWSERGFDFRPSGAAYCLLDADLKASLIFRLPILTAAAGSPVIVRSSRSAWITTAKTTWQVRADGSLGDPLDAGVSASDMALATDFPQLVAGQLGSDGFTCRQELGCTVIGGPFRGLCISSCQIPNRVYDLQFVSLYTLSTVQRFRFDSAAAPAIGTDGRDVVIAWFQGAEANGGNVVASRLQLSSFSDFPKTAQNPLILGSYAPTTDVTRPAIASDGERYVVVWHTTGTHGERNIIGASLDRNGNVVPLSIATSLDDERYPSVIAVGPGKFLVAYEKIDSVIDRRIAGRFVTFDERSHAVR
jgi:hypothetical protein